MVDAPLTLEGWLSIRAALISGNREVHELLVQRGKTSRSLQALQKRARDQNVPCRSVSAEDLSAYTQGQTHGGAVALVGPRRFAALSALGRGPQAAFLAMLDGVEDPFNFGQAVRALHAAGAHGLILRPRNWTSAAATVGRASAGASEFMPMAIAESDEAVLEHMRTRHIRILCTSAGSRTTSLFESDLSTPLLLVIGGERRGVSKTLLAAADQNLQIPYGRNFKQSLGTAAATAILAFEVLRQRR